MRRSASALQAPVLFTLGLWFLLAGAWTAVSNSTYAAVSNTDVRRVAEKLQCPVCEGTSVADSASPVAEGMRATIRTKLDAGESEAVILQYFVDRYGPAILREPPSTGIYSAVWWVPALALAAGLALVFGLLRKSRPKAAPPPSPPIPDPVSPNDQASYRERLRKEIERRS